jgi:hypothetical protein
MANNLLTISMITNEALMVLENELTFTGQVDRNYDDQFAVVGAKIGNTVNVRRPGRFIGTTGPALNVEDFNETSTPVVLNTQFPCGHAVHNPGLEPLARYVLGSRSEARHCCDCQQD